MPISINLGRINTCKIVGTKDRFIENRCIDEAIPESWDCDPTTGTCIDPGDGSGQWPTEAACIAAPAFSNTCASLLDSGVVGGNASSTTMFNWQSINDPAAPFAGNLPFNAGAYYYENTSGTASTAQDCIGPNGGRYEVIVSVKFLDLTFTPVHTATSINDIVTYINTAAGAVVVSAGNTLQQYLDAYKLAIGGDPGQSYISLSLTACGCTGCGSGHGASFDCVQQSGTATCVDPGTGNGQYSTLAACNAALAAGSVNSCDTNSAAGGARVNAAAGTIFATEADAIEYYTDPANGISGTDASTLFFEIANVPGSGNPCESGLSNVNCCEGPNSTAGSPTYIMYLPYLYIQYGFMPSMNCTCNVISTTFHGLSVCDCCPRGGFNSTTNQPISAMVGNCHPTYFTGDYLSLYGMNDLGVTQSWTWDAILTDAIAAGAPVTMNTPYSINGNIQDANAFLSILWAWLDTNPSPTPDTDCHNCTVNNICYQGCPNANPTGGYPNCSRPTICVGTEVCECETSCTGESWDCDPKTQTCYDPGTGLGPYTTHADCIAAGCTPPSESWECIDGSCQDPGNGTGQYSTLAACQAATGANTCATATYTPAFAQPYCPGVSGNIQYDYMVSNGFTNVPLTNYMWESCNPDSGQGFCLGPNGFEVFRFHNFRIDQQGVPVHTFSNTATIDDVVAWCNANIGPGFTNTMTLTQLNNYSYTFPGWEQPFQSRNIRIAIQACGCTDCGGTDLYDCVPGAGCQVVAGGQYATLAACQAATAPTDTCDGTTVIPTPQADPATAFEELTTNYPTVDISTISAQIITGADPCRPPLSGTQTHCPGKEGHPTYKFGAYQFIDITTNGPLTGLAASYTKWSDFLTAAQAIPIAGIGPTTGFADACQAINTHFGSSNGICSTCPDPLDNDVVPGVWDLTNGQPGTPGSLGVPADGRWGINGIMEYITTQANGYTSKNGPDQSGACSAGVYNIVPASSNPQCNSNTTNSTCSGATPFLAPNGCQYYQAPSFVLLNFMLPNGPWYRNWDDFLADLVADGCPGVTLTSSWCDVFNCWGDPNPTGNKIKAHYGSNTSIVATGGPCQCGTSNTISQCSVTYECCVCEDGGCPDPEPPSRGECLTLWLHADKSKIVTHPTYPAVPPNLGGTTYYVTEWHNLAYDSLAGVYPADPTAYYTYDTITPDFTTAPIFDDTTFAPNNAIMFDEYGVGAVSKFLIANPNGPAVKPLEPDTNPDTAYGKGWTIFFRRCTNEAGWSNDKSWFMGDDWSQSSPAIMEKASGLKPAGQPYCRSVLFGHNHANETANDNQYEASYINEQSLGNDLYLPEGCYTHWIRACETQPVGTANNTFDVMWGIGSQTLFLDTMNDVSMDMILENINTRNRDKAFTQAGWYQEIRAYNCCFTKTEIKLEIQSIDSHWGNTLLPQQLPKPCGGERNQVGNVINFDGVDQTRVEVVEAGGNETILPSNEGFTAAFWVRMNDCVDDDACFFEKGINLPGSNEEVAFRLFLSDDIGQVGNLYWDVFGDAPVDYLNNYSRTISNVAWLGEANCAALVGKWKHVAVTMDGLNGTNRKIYVNGVDITGVTGGGTQVISGKVKRNSNYPLVIGDSSRPDFTFKGDFSQFMTWNKALSKGEIQDVYNNGGMWAPDTNTDTGFSKILGLTPYTDENRLTFYTNFDSDPITHETQYSYTINKYGGVNLENTTDVDNAVLPTDISGLQCWFRANTKQLFDLDFSNSKIIRATYMVGNLPQLKDKIRIWECHGNTGRYCMPDAVNTQTEKMLYQQTTQASAIIAPGGLYTNGSKQLQIFHTKADGGIQFPAADGTVGAFTIMVKIRLEAFANEAVYGNTSDNMMRVNNTTEVRYKLGGAGSADFTVPAAMTNAQPYIFTLQRDVDGNLTAYIDGGAFTDQALTGTFTDADAFKIDYLGGVPSQGMQGWIFDFLAWETKLNDAQRKAQYRVINQTIRTL